MDIILTKAFEPDYRHIVDAARNKAARRIPLYEHGIGDGIMESITGARPQEKFWGTDRALHAEGAREFWAFWKQMGYDTASMEYQITGILPGGGALGAHKEGCIKDRQDFARYPWDELEDRFFQKYTPYIQAFEQARPDGMMAIGGVGNGVFECVQDLVGYLDLCYMKADDEVLYDDLFQKMADVHTAIWKRFLRDHAGAFCLMRFGDDLGFDTATLISHDDIRRLIFPCYRRIVDMAHAAGRPFLLHSCGNLFAIFDELIDATGIDAKHSNEDKIGHFSVWTERFGDRIGNFGGIDTDVICRESPEAISAYVNDCLHKVAGRGGIAFGSGNSIPDYVDVNGYLTMTETVRKFRGE